MHFLLTRTLTTSSLTYTLTLQIKRERLVGVGCECCLYVFFRNLFEWMKQTSVLQTKDLVS